ncbi:MAG: multidrug effflux MFS transporter [Candidatus Nanopelagicales bacterium]
MLRRRLLVLLAALTSFGPMSMDLYLPGFPAIAERFGTDQSAVQLTFSAALLGLGAGQVLWGPLSDRYGRRRPLLVGLAVFITASLLIPWSPSLPIMVALRLVQTLGGAAGIVIARATVRDIYSGTELARALSAIVTVFALAPVVAPVLGSLVLLVASWEWMFVLLAGFGALCAAGVLLMPETLPPDRRSTHGLVGALQQYGDILRSGRFRLAAAVAALGSVALFAYISSSPAVFIEGYGIGQTAFALLFAGLALCFAVGAQVNLRLLRRYGVSALLRVSVATQVVAALGVLTVALLTAPMAAMVVPLALAMMTVAGVNSNALALALDPFPKSAGSAAALAGGIQQLTGGLAAALIAALAVAPAVGMGLGMVPASVVSLALLAAGAARTRRSG